MFRKVAVCFVLVFVSSLLFIRFESRPKEKEMMQSTTVVDKFGQTHVNSDAICCNQSLVSVLLPLANWIGYESYFNASIILAFWTCLAFIMLLVVICMLLTPPDNSTRSPSSSSSLSVDSSDDLMLEILLRLPPKPLTRLKLVSKRWESLITTNHASFLQNRGPLGLICPGQRVPSFEFVPLDVQNPAQLPFSELRFPWGLLGGLHWITKSCNGLLLCCNARSYYLDPTLRPGNFGYSSIWFPELSCCVYNPTTKCVARIPRPGGYPRLLIGLNLVYDPAKYSPGYKVIIMESVGGHVQIEIYSSESRSWRLFGDPVRAFGRFSHGVYWNGSIHWLTRSGKNLLYFNVEKEEFGKKVPLPPALLNHKFMFQVFDYFGESRGHLHVIGIRGKSITVAFDVHELKKDYSGWFVRYRVDLTNFRELNDYRIFSLVRGEEGKRQSFLMLIEATGALYYFKTTGKFARWNLDSNSLEEIFVNDNIVSEDRMISYAFQHTESLATV